MSAWPKCKSLSYNRKLVYGHVRDRRVTTGNHYRSNGYGVIDTASGIDPFSRQPSSILYYFSFSSSAHWLPTPNRTYGFSERQVERSDIRISKQENRHGDDVADDQLRSRVRGRLQPAVHGDRYIDSSYQTYRHHFTDCVPWYVPQGTRLGLYVRLMCFSLNISTYRFWFLNFSYL